MCLFLVTTKQSYKQNMHAGKNFEDVPLPLKNKFPKKFRNT